MDTQKEVYPHARKIGLRIRTLRERKRMSTDRLGKLIGLSQQQVSAIERGKSDTGVETFAAMSEALGVKWEVLTCEEAWEAVREMQKRDMGTVIAELVQLCVESPRRVPLIMSIFAAQLQTEYAQNEEGSQSSKE